MTSLPGDSTGPLGAQLRRAPDLEDIVDLECLLCPGLVDRVALHEVRNVAREHLSSLHPIEVAALQATLARPDQLDQVLAQHWRGRAAVPVCDACYSILEPPYWDHTSTPPTHSGGFRDDDGGWLLCDTCHDLCAAGRPGAWVRHAWTSTTARYPWLLRLSPDGQIGSRAELAGTLRLLVSQLDEGKRLSL